MRLEDKVAIVTGAGQGIGREYAKTLANEGAKVVVAEINPDTGQQVSEEINELGGVATYLPLDLAQEQSCLDLADAVVTASAASTFSSTTAPSTTACAPTPSALSISTISSTSWRST